MVILKSGCLSTGIKASPVVTSVRKLAVFSRRQPNGARPSKEAVDLRVVDVHDLAIENAVPSGRRTPEHQTPDP